MLSGMQPAASSTPRHPIRSKGAAHQRARPAQPRPEKTKGLRVFDPETPQRARTPSGPSQTSRLTARRTKEARAGGMLSRRSTLYGTACKNDGMMYIILLTETHLHGLLPRVLKAQPHGPADGHWGCPETRLHGGSGQSSPKALCASPITGQPQCPSHGVHSHATPAVWLLLPCGRNEHYREGPKGL